MTTETPLSADRVEAILMDCLFKDEELQDDKVPHNAVRVEGVVNHYGFHPERLRSHADEITIMLHELPSEFMQSSGGGMSFLQACMDKHGNQWTGLHRTMEHLFCLGMGIGKVKCLLPREMWSALPGSVPYYVVDDV